MRETISRDVQISTRVKIIAETSRIHFTSLSHTNTASLPPLDSRLIISSTFPIRGSSQSEEECLFPFFLFFLLPHQLLEREKAEGWVVTAKSLWHPFFFHLIFSFPFAWSRAIHCVRTQEYTSSLFPSLSLSSFFSRVYWITLFLQPPENKKMG